MKTIKFSLAGLIFILLIWQCKNMTKKGKDFPGEDEIAVSWELISNDVSERSTYSAEFLIENRSKFEMGGSGWCMYFNQMAGNVIPESVSREVRFEHINGDLYRMFPTKYFSLEPGDSITINYNGRGWFIKKAFAPLGLYFVFSDSTNKKQAAIAVLNYTIKPFPDPDKIFPSETGVPVPDASWQYDENRGIKLLSKDELQRIVPTPVKLTFKDQKVSLVAGLVIHYGEGLDKEAEHLAALLEKVMGEKPRVMKSGVGGTNIVTLKTGPVQINNKNEETYLLEASPDQGVVITGSDAAGVFYGIQSLLALVPVKLYESPGTTIEIDAVSIYDAPAFAYRGMHLDLARNFINKSSILKLLEIMSFYKMNRLHLHLSDDEGWRLEIEELPELTEIGGYRGHTIGSKEYLLPAYGSGPYPDPAKSSGSGFLTRQDFKEIIRFARDRHIEVIPEINMPGHARAAIKSMEVRYNRLLAEGKVNEAEEYLLNDLNDSSKYLSAQNFTDNVVCVCKDAVYNFYETVVDDIIEMYREAEIPLTTIHTGGDEVPQGAWEKSPVCIRFLKENQSIGNVRNLQSYFFGRIVDLLKERNLDIAGWEEVAMEFEGPGEWSPNTDFIGQNVIPYVWNSVWGNQDLGYKLANGGYPVILCNVNNFYFDLAYNHHPDEPGLYWGGFVDTRKAFEFVPFDLYKSAFEDPMGHPFDPDSDFKDMERLKPEARRNIIGLQGELWSETIKNQEMLEYYYLPKMLGLAERAWVGQPAWGSVEETEERKNTILDAWNVFANTLGQSEFPRLDYIFGGFNYRIPPPGAVIRDGALYVNNTYPGLTIRYTTDGAEPNEKSTVYDKPVQVSGTVILKAFNSRGRCSRSSEVKGE